jgi:dolichyl-phosphate-mannose-protein mannosyltransferase
LIEGETSKDKELFFIIALTSIIFLSHMYIINTPPTSGCTHTPSQSPDQKIPGCVMDEVYYVPAALALVQGQKCPLSTGNLCNPEHPFLSKALIAFGIFLFGNNTYGWRFFIVLTGTASIPVFFYLMKRLTNNRKLNYFATLLFSSDTLFFVHSSIAVIDVPSIFFSLVSFFFYFSEYRLWKFNKFILSGIFIGLSALSKETGAFFLLTLASYHIMRKGYGNIMNRIYECALMTVASLSVFSLLLQLYDTMYVQGSPLFIQHIQYILSYSTGLKGGEWSGGLFNSLIYPFDWITFFRPVGYFVTNVTVNPGNIVYTSIGYFGIPNMVVVWLIYGWIPLVCLKLLGRLKEQSETSKSDYEAAKFSLVWFATGYLPYVALWLILGRTTYPFYLLQVIPALAIGASYFITREWFPSKLAYIYIGASFGWFFFYYPVKDFLPLWVRAVLSR